MASISITAERRSSRLPILLATALVVVAAIAAAALYLRADSGTASPRASASVATGADDRATLTAEFSGLQPGASYVAHLHSGTPAQPAASTGVLGTVTAGADGRAQLSASSVKAGAVGAEVQLTGELLRDGPRFIDLHSTSSGEQSALTAVVTVP